MINRTDLATMRAVALCHKAFLKPEEALIYCNLGRTQLANKCTEYGIYKTNSGYYVRAELDRMMAGELPSLTQRVSQLKVGKGAS